MSETDAEDDIAAFVEQVVVQVEAAAVVVPDDHFFGPGVEKTLGAGVGLAGGLQLGKLQVEGLVERSAGRSDGAGDAIAVYGDDEFHGGLPGDGDERQVSSLANL